MKKLFLITLACLLVGCLSSQKKKQTSGYIYIPDRTVAKQQPIIVTPDQVTKFLNEPVVLVKYNTSLYSGPSFSNNSLNSLVDGQSISLLGEYQDWYQAKDSTGCVGWIAKKWVSDPAEIKQPEKQVEIAGTETSTTNVRTDLFCKRSIWEALSGDEKKSLSQKYTVLTYPDDKYGVVINAQIADRSHYNRNGMAEVGSVVGQAMYIDNSSWGSYSALSQIGVGLLGAIIGSSLDEPTQIEYETQYTLRLLDGQIVTRTKYGQSNFHTAPGVCVDAQLLIPAGASYCADINVDAFRKQYSADLKKE